MRSQDSSARSAKGPAPKCRCALRRDTSTFAGTFEELRIEPGTLRKVDDMAAGVGLSRTALIRLLLFKAAKEGRFRVG